MSKIKFLFMNERKFDTVFIVKYVFFNNTIFKESYSITQRRQFSFDCLTWIAFNDRPDHTNERTVPQV